MLCVWCNHGYTQQSEEMFKLGIEAFQRSDFKHADSLFTLSIRYAKSNGTLTFENYYNRGVTRRELSLIDLAIKDLDSSIQMNPKYFQAYHDISVCYYYSEQYDKCIEFVDKGLKLKTDNLDVYVLGAMACLGMQDIKKGSIYCSRGKMIKKDSRFYGIQALLFLQNSDIVKAKKEIDLGERYFTQSDDIIEAKVYYWYLLGNFDEMTKNYSQLGSNYPFLIKDVEFISRLKAIESEIEN